MAFITSIEDELFCFLSPGRSIIIFKGEKRRKYWERDKQEKKDGG